MNKSLDAICKILAKQTAGLRKEERDYRYSPSEGSSALARSLLDDLNDVRNGIKQLATMPSQSRNRMRDSFGFLAQVPDWQQFIQGKDLPIYGLDNLPAGEILMAEMPGARVGVVELPVIANYITALDGRETLWENELFALNTHFKRMPLAKYFFTSESSLRVSTPGIIVMEGVHYYLKNAERALDDWAKRLKA